MERTIFSAEHDAFRALARDFLQQHVVPNHDDWEREGIAPREALALAGRSGLVGFNIPEEYGGGGVPDDFRFNAIVAEQIARAAVRIDTDGSATVSTTTSTRPAAYPMIKVSREKGWQQS